MELMPHQIKAVSKLKPGKVLVGGVGTGKSFTSLAFFLKEYRYKDLYIITTAKKRDKKEWHEDCSLLDIDNVIIDSWASIKKYVGIKDAFFIFDEQKTVGQGIWANSFIKIARENTWIMLTATPADDWMDYASLFIANNFYKNRTQFKTRHVIYNPYITNFPSISGYREEDLLEMYRDRLLINMEFKKKAVRKNHIVFTNFDIDRYNIIAKDRFNPWEVRPIKNASEYTQCLRKCVGTNSEKLDKVAAIFNKHKRAIVYYNYNYELDILRQFCSDNNIVYSEWNGQKHEEIVNNDEWLYLVQYTSGAEGWNCVETDCIIFYSLNYSYKVMEQAKGRIDRLNTPYHILHYYILSTNSPIDKSVLNAIDKKKKFSEKAFYEGSSKLFKEEGMYE